MDAKRRKDPDAALLLEFLGGLAGVLGIGWFYAGSPRVGVLALLAWWICLVPIGLLFLVSYAAGCCCCWPVFGLLWLAGPLCSGFAVRDALEARQGS